ncbi:hypothetical protein JCM21900_006401 [Sporobolomyces salmonicolor]
MARGKKPTNQVAQRPKPAAPAAPAAPAQPSSRLSIPPPSPLPLGHYLPRVPLQLFAVFFCFRAASASHHPGSNPRYPHTRILASIIHDPVGTLPLACALLALVQIWFGLWVKGCRKQAGKTVEGEQEGGEKKEKEEVKERRSLTAGMGDLWSKALRGEAPHQRLWKKARKGGAGSAVKGLDTSFVVPAVATTLVGAVVFHICAIFLGAPLLANIQETALTALLVSVLAILPLSIAVPPVFVSNAATERYTWLRFFSFVSPNDDLELALLAPALGAIIGCWAGAIPIPLDWDRPWQAWPTTCVLGALSGHALGSVVALVVAAYHTAVRTAASALEFVKSE